nr:hypothetical protein [Tanacetum cinerariifolium]
MSKLPKLKNLRRSHSNSPLRGGSGNASVTGKDSPVSINDKDKAEKRSFTKEIKQKCWNMAETVQGRDPERWRKVAAGNIVFRGFNNRNGALCYESDHIQPYVKGMLSVFGFIDECFREFPSLPLFSTYRSDSDMLPSPYEAFLSLLVSQPLLLGRTFRSEGADVRRVPEMYTTDALASS